MQVGDKRYIYVEVDKLNGMRTEKTIWAKNKEEAVKKGMPGISIK